jgi:hypothetical protein
MCNVAVIEFFIESVEKKFKGKRFAIPASMFVIALTIRLVIALQGIHGTELT